MVHREGHGDVIKKKGSSGNFLFFVVFWAGYGEGFAQIENAEVHFSSEVRSILHIREIEYLILCDDPGRTKVTLMSIAQLKGGDCVEETGAPQSRPEQDPNLN